MNNKSVSLIIPVFNEEDSIVELIHEILFVLKNNQIHDYEIIIVNDGSMDKTWTNISKLCKNNYFTIRISSNSLSHQSSDCSNFIMNLLHLR